MMSALVADNVVVVDTTNSLHARLKPVSMTNVSLEDGFWQSRVQTIKTETIKSQYDLLESTGRLDNFRRIIEKNNKPYQGYVFNDSDVYKWLEAASWMIRFDDDIRLKRMVDQTLALISKAQDKNGYINTYFSDERTNERWANLQENHELYCAGHLIQAAIAHFRATGDDQLLEVAVRYADHIYSTFGPTGRKGTSGHPEIEMAMVELYRTTKEVRYLDLATIFIDRRGHRILGGMEYYLDHLPFRQLEHLAGHAVRALYLCSGAADLYLETGEKQLLTTLERLWVNVVEQQMYITGGLGARHDGEAFGMPYELPNASAYAETCASIASILWNWRMLQISGNAQYSDLLEWTYFNGLLPGISLQGNEYFYTNPLLDDGNHRREKWFDCACCPPNISRTIAAFPGYIYSISEEGLWVHLYASSSADIALQSGQRVHLEQATGYPWDGRVTLRIGRLTQPQIDGERRGNKEFSLFLRLPGWLEAQHATIRINDEIFNYQTNSGSYLEIRRKWRTGDMVIIDLPIEVRYIESHPNVSENIGHIAITRGPLVYCFEAEDNPKVSLGEMYINPAHEVETKFRPDVLGGIVQLRFLAEQRAIDSNWKGKLYRSLSSFKNRNAPIEKEILSVPYYAWANRKPGEMVIWQPYS